MSWIDQTDMIASIRDAKLTQMIDGDSTVLENAVDAAGIFATTSTARPNNVMRWVKHIALWYLYERLPDAMTPKKVEKNYDDVMSFLGEVSSGDASVNLPHKPDPNNASKSLTKFRWGSNTKRSL
jgi:uncharacterized membrane protein